MSTYASILALDINRAELEQPLEEPVAPLGQAQLSLFVQHLHLLLVPRRWYQQGPGGRGTPTLVQDETAGFAEETCIAIPLGKHQRHDRPP